MLSKSWGQNENKILDWNFSYGFLFFIQNLTSGLELQGLQDVEIQTSIHMFFSDLF